MSVPLNPTIDLDSPIITAGEVLDTFHALAELTRSMPKISKRRIITTASEAATTSCLRKALESATGKTGEVMRAANVKPNFCDLHHHALQAHKHTHDRGSAAKGRVHQAMCRLTGKNGFGHTVDPESQFLSDEYRPLLKHTTHPSRLRQYARMNAMAAGTAAQPASHDDLASAAEKLKIKASTVRTTLSIYRVARQAAVTEDPSAVARFGYLPEKLDLTKNHRNTLHRLADEVTGPRARGLPPLSTSEALKLVMPVLKRQLDTLLNGSEELSRDLTPATRLSISQYANMVPSLMVEGGHAAALRTTGFRELYTEFISHEYEAVDHLANETAAPKLRQGSTLLLQHLIDVRTSQVAQRSVRREDMLNKGRIVYGPDAEHMETMLWCAASRLAGSMQASDKAAWQLMEQRHLGLMRHIKKNGIEKSQSSTGKDLVRLLNANTMAQTACIGAPMLYREVGIAEAAYSDALRRATATLGTAADCHPEVVKLRAAWGRLNFRALVFAFPEFTGLRDQNYTLGLFGEHFIPNFDDGGQLSSLALRFTRVRSDPAHFKDVKNAKGFKPEKREQIVRPGLIPLKLISDHLLVHRVHDLIARRAVIGGKLIQNVTDYNIHAELADPKYAFFVSRTKNASKRLAHTGLSNIYGEVMINDICRRFLGRDLPEWRDLPTEWHHIKTVHVARAKLATLIGAVMGLWPEAEKLTDDLETTLRSSYAVSGTSWADERNSNILDWENPHSYNDMIRRLYGFREQPYETFDPLSELFGPTSEVRPILIPPAAWALLKSWSAPKCKSGKTVGPKFRAKRPAQATSMNRGGAKRLRDSRRAA